MVAGSIVGPKNP